MSCIFAILVSAEKEKPAGDSPAGLVMDKASVIISLLHIEFVVIQLGVQYDFVIAWQ